MAENNPPGQMTDQLRSMVLTLNPNDIGLTRENFPYPVFALLVETGFSEGWFTLSSVADGTTSLYFSSGGGIIGGGEHEDVRRASGLLLSRAQHFVKPARKVTTFPTPEPGEVVFYFVTFEGVRAYSAPEDDLGNKKDEFSELFFAAHNVITALRKIEDKKGRSEK